MGVANQVLNLLLVVVHSSRRRFIELSQSHDTMSKSMAEFGSGEVFSQHFRQEQAGHISHNPTEKAD